MEALLAGLLAADPSFGYAHVLCSAFTSQAPPAARPRDIRGTEAIVSLEETLCQREIDVLRLLATTLSSSEIADELCVATSTIRSHTKAIYGKLGVHTRLEAIDQARVL